jgi:hypothetical protein
LFTAPPTTIPPCCRDHAGKSVPPPRRETRTGVLQDGQLEAALQVVAALVVALGAAHERVVARLKLELADGVEDPPLPEDGAVVLLAGADVGLDLVGRERCVHQ